jgi:multidrug efflux system outer membrane protein
MQAWCSAQNRVQASQPSAWQRRIERHDKASRLRILIPFFFCMHRFCLIPLIFLTSCAVGPNFVAPEGTTQERFRSKASGILAAPPDEGGLQAWWQRFGDPKLNDLIGQTITNNQDVKAAIANIKAVRAERNFARFDFAPVVTSESSYTNRRSTGFNLPSILPRDLETYNTSFDATWELDLFGRVRRNVEAVSAELAAAEAVRDDLLVSVTAETALTYMQLRGLQNQLDVARRNADNQRATLGLTEKLLEGGRGTDLDTSRARAQLSTTLATLAPLEGSVDKAFHRLAVLTGQPPDTLRGRLKLAPLPSRLPSIHLGDPASLLRRRPDIRASERQLAAATARIGVATADLFPRITLNGNAGLTAGSFTGLGVSRADNFSFGPSISWAFLDSPRRLQLVKAAGARTEGRLAAYQQTVLLALEDVENSITDYGREQTRRNHLADAVKSSAKAASLARQRFDQGAAGFLEVLDSERVKLQAEVALAESQTRTATNLIAVFKALGGGWDAQGRAK